MKFCVVVYIELIENLPDFVCYFGGLFISGRCQGDNSFLFSLVRYGDNRLEVARQSLIPYVSVFHRTPLQNAETFFLAI